MGYDHALTAITSSDAEKGLPSFRLATVNSAWLHSTFPGRHPVIHIGAGNMPWTIRAVCDPPPGADEQPFCWCGPDRDTVEEAVVDARAHAPDGEFDIPVYEDVWPPLDDLLRQYRRDALAPPASLLDILLTVASHAPERWQADGETEAS